MWTVKKKDKVSVLSGKDRGKRGEVLRVDPQGRRVWVSKVNVVKKHFRGTQQKPGGIQQMEAPLSVSKVALVCPKCDRPMRPRFDRLAGGEKVRLCRRCGETIV
ncbi:MAG: 50S ribosomal protein L24 [Elusimicrobia bacterium]|nr:50S ribosomal protein L24 [Elusimicrobiota bacterium]